MCIRDRDSSAVAWQEEEDIYGGKNIQVFYMDDGTNFTIHASEGETIRALGFILSLIHI